MGLTPNLLAGLDQFTCAIYGRRQFKDVNVLRYMLIKDRCGLHDGSIHLNKNMDLRAYHHVDVHWYNIYWGLTSKWSFGNELQRQLLLCQNLLIDMDGRNMKAKWYLCGLRVVVYLKFCQPRWLSVMRRSFVHSLMIAPHWVLRNWDLISVRAVRGLISRTGMVSIFLLLRQRDVKLQQAKSTWNSDR